MFFLRQAYLIILKAARCLALLLFSLPVALTAQAPDWQWGKGSGSVSIIYEFGNSTAVDQVNGSVYTAGYFIGTVDFDPGPDSFYLSEVEGAVFVSKLNASGNFLWAIALEEFTYDPHIAIDPANHDICITGRYSGTIDFDPGPDSFHLTSAFIDVFILRLDAAGNFIWAKSIGGNDLDVAGGIAIDPGRSDIYLTGSFKTTADFDPGPGTFNLTAAGLEDVFVTKLDAAGDFVWAKAFSGGNSEVGISIAFDAARSDVLITGSYKGTVDFDPGTGTFNLTSLGYEDTFISKLDDAGDFVWAKSIGNVSYDFVHSITTGFAQTGDVYTAGNYDGTVDFDPGTGTFNLASVGCQDIFISKLDSAGNFQWAKSIGGPGCDVCYAIAFDQRQNGEVFITGSFPSIVDFDPGSESFLLTSAGGYDMFTCKFDDAGSFLWANATGGAGYEEGRSITTGPDGHAHVTGFFTSPVLVVGPDTLINSDTIVYEDDFGEPTFSSDILVAKLNLCSTNVTSIEDAGPGTLRDIIQSCASNGSTISFDLPPMSQIILTSGEILIDKNLRITGSGIYDLTLSGNNTSRIFHLLPGKELMLEDLALKNASQTTQGGAIWVEGDLEIRNVLFENNLQNGLPKALTLSPGIDLTIIENIMIRL